MTIWFFEFLLLIVFGVIFDFTEIFENAILNILQYDL